MVLSPKRQPTHDVPDLEVPRQSHRILGFDGLRAFAVLMVLTYHFLQGANLPYTSGGLLQAVLNVIYKGGLGVDLFFVLSGFLMTGILRKEKANAKEFKRYWWRFATRRAFRILPIYYLLVVVAFSLTLDSEEALAVPWWAFVIHPLPLQNWLLGFGYHTSEVLSVTWSLAVEEHFYLFWPFAVWFLRREGLKRLTVWLICLACVIRPLIYVAYGYSAVYQLTVTRMDALLMGALAYLLYSERHVLSRVWAQRLAFPLLLALALLVSSGYANPETFPYAIAGYPFVALTFGVLVTAVRELQTHRFVRALEWKPLSVLGDQYSYGLYVWHLLALALAYTILDAIELSPHNSLMGFAALTLSFLSILGVIVFWSRRYERWWLFVRDRLTRE